MIAVNQKKDLSFVVLYQLLCDTCFAFVTVNIFEFRKNHLNSDSFFIFRCNKCGYETYVSKETLDNNPNALRIHRH